LAGFGPWTNFDRGRLGQGHVAEGFGIDAIEEQDWRFPHNWL
jgi:hypothetical protein